MPDHGDYQLYDKDMPLMDAPAFVRRAREVELAGTALRESCSCERTRLLDMPRMRLVRLFALGPAGFSLSAVLREPEELQYLEGLYQEWQPRLRSKVSPAGSTAELAKGVAELALSFARFNRRWMKTLNELDLARINALREGYNRFYVLEKECALRSTRIAREGFQRLEPVTIQDLLDEFPLLKIPQSREFRG